MSQFNFNQEFPKIGASVEEFVKVFGQPLPESEKDSIQVRFDVNVENSSYLLLAQLDDSVYNISWTLPFSPSEAKTISEKFLPSDAVLNGEHLDVINQMINGDAAVSIFEYKSDLSMDSKGYVSNESHKGFITVYVSEDSGSSNLVVALGREELVQK